MNLKINDSVECRKNHEKMSRNVAREKDSWDAYQKAIEICPENVEDIMFCTVMETSKLVNEMCGELSFETKVINALEEHLLECGHTVEYSLMKDELFNECLLGTEFQDTLEWDGVMFCREPPTLYLIVAQTTIDTDKFVRMSNRIQRTKTFIELCASSSIDIMGRNASLACAMWGCFSEADVRGVIGTHTFTDDIFKLACDAEYMRICM